MNKYQELTKIREVINSNRLKINKANDIRNKLKQFISDSYKKIEGLRKIEEGIIFDLIMDNVAKDDILTINGTLWSISGIKGGDTVKVIRKNKKSLSVEVIDVDLVRYNYPSYRESQLKRIGYRSRINNKHLPSLLFTNLETMIKRNESLKFLLEE